MDEKKLRHIGYLTAACAGASVAIGLFIQIGLRIILANSVEGVRFEGVQLLGMLKAILVMACMGGTIGAMCGLFTSPDGSKGAEGKGAGGKAGTSADKPDVDEAARETLAKLGIPDKPDSRSK